MRERLACLIGGENVKAILHKIQSCHQENLNYKSRIKELLLRKHKLNLQIADLEKQYKGIDVKIAALKDEVEGKRPLKILARQIEQIEKDIDIKEKELTNSTSRIDELSHSVTCLNKDIRKLKVRKAELEAEKRKCEDSLDEGGNNSEKLQSVNSVVTGLQDWLRIHSVELTQIERDIAERILALEENEEPLEVPQNELRDEENIESDSDAETHIANVGAKQDKKPEEGEPNKAVESPIRKKREHKIKEIFDLETGETINAEEFFKKSIDELESWRAIYQQYISKNNRRFICPKCLEMIRISGKGDERGVPAIFTHKNDSVYCKKTTTGQSEEDVNRKKYGLYGQSQRHKDLKQQLYQCLCNRNSVSLGVTNLEMEKRVYSILPFFSWRQPDIQIEYKGHNIVFEIQLSTTFLSVITERDTFYRLNDYYIIWIFNFDDNRKYVDLSNLAMKDIYFANKRNAFIFDDEAMEWSKESGQLVLKCNWVEPNSTWHYANTEKRFGGERVTLDMLKFDHNTHKLYYYDAETPYFEQHPDVAQRLMAEQKTKEELIAELEQKAQENEIRKQKAIEQMMRDGGNVRPFEEKKKIGFKYGITTIIAPKYTSCEKKDDGTYIVKYGPHKGVINQYGEIVIPCKSTDIRTFGSQLTIYKIKEEKAYFWRIPHFDDYKLLFNKSHFWTSADIKDSVLAVRLCRTEVDVVETIYCWKDSILIDRGYNSWRVYDKLGNPLSERAYDKIEFVDENRAKVTFKDIEGYINSRGEEIPVIVDFPDGYKSANLMGKYALMSPLGELMSDYSYDALDYFSDGIYVFGEFEKKEYSDNWYSTSKYHIIKQYYLADRNLHPVTQHYSKIDKPVNGIAYAYSGSGKGYDYESGKMNYKGMVYQLTDYGIILPDEIVDLPNGNKIAKYGVEWDSHKKREGEHKYSVLLNADNNVISESFSEMEDIGGGYIIAKKEHKQIGVIDYGGKIQISFEYEQIEPMDIYGVKLLSVKKDGKSGQIDFDNHILVPIKFDNILGYKNKPYIIVERRRKIIKKNYYGWTTSYIERFYGLYHISGKKALDAEYSSITIDKDMVVHFVFNGRKGHLGEGNNIVFEQTINIPLGQTVDVVIKSVHTGRKFLLAESTDGNSTFIHWSWLNCSKNLNAYKVGDKLKLLNNGYDEKRKRIIWKETSESKI